MKATIATVKSFIRRNKNNLLILCTSDFDGMTDCVQQNPGAKWHKAIPVEEGHRLKNNEGIKGVCFVGRCRDYVTPVDEPEITGWEVSNSCGCWSVGIAKN